MALNTSSSFGAILRKAQDIIAFFPSFQGYNPPRSEESPAQMGALVADIVGLNATEIALLESYRLATDLRLNAFTKGPCSAEQLLLSVKRVVESQYGRKSPEAAIIAGITKKMYSLPVLTSAGGENTEAPKRKYSHSQRSFGAITQIFNDVVSTLQQFTAYAPANDALTIASLQATALHLTQLNDEVANSSVLLKNARTGRKEKYAELTDRIRRIKSYVYAQYGTRSNEAKMIRGTGI